MRKIYSYVLYRLLGWEIVGEFPNRDKSFLFVFLPHTSNWDFVIGMLVIKAEKFKVVAFGKDGFYYFPFKALYRYFNVIPIRRDKSDNFVSQAFRRFRDSKPLWAAMAPEGTRSKVSELKSGYYYLAEKAKVSVVVVGLDFVRKSLVIQEPRQILATLADDQASLLNFSRTITGKRPHLSI
jgi:1-acyl-sn-glycerol-3-phosphate acyltransferase